jgi:hypothetical protein
VLTNIMNNERIITCSDRGDPVLCEGNIGEGSR